MIQMGKAGRRVCAVLVVDDLGYGGAERQVVELANHMDRSRFDVHVCALSKHIPLGNELRNAEQTLHVIETRTRFDVTVVYRLFRLLRRLRADIVHGYLFRAEIVSRLAGRLAGTNLVLGSERNAYRTTVRKGNVLAYRLTQCYADIIVANSNAGAESHRQIFQRPSGDYRVVHNGVNIERFRPLDGTGIRQELGIPLQIPVVGAFANFKMQKNHSMLFKAFKLVLESFPEARLLLVGDQPTDSRGRLAQYISQLDHLVDELGIRSQCIFLGHQKNTEHLYPACDVTVLSSLHEGTPNVLLESMACGVPPIATRVCDNDYVIKENEVGYLVTVGDEAEMAHRIKLLLHNGVLRQEIGQKARDWVVEEFSCTRLAQKTEAVYLELLAERRE